MSTEGRKNLALSSAVVTWTAFAMCLLLGITHGQDLAGLARTARAEAEMEVHRQNVVSLGRAARARPSVRFTAPATAFGFAAGVGGGLARRTSLSSSAKLAKVHGSRTVPPAFATAARVFQLSANTFLQRTGTNARAFTSAPSAPAVASFRAALTGICPIPPLCNAFEPYRRADGTCNNLLFPLQGSQSTPQPRYLFAAYQDSFQLFAPRLRGVGGLPLPSARAVSNAVHRGVGPELKEPGITLFLMQYGQFTDHDIVITPIATESNGDSIECCEGGVVKPDPHPECLPIRIPPADPHFPPGKMCMNFVRSIPAIDISCIPGQRQQLNRLTSYIDASNVYGSTQPEQNFLRTFVGGRLRERFGENLPEDPEPCDVVAPDYCLKAGDERVMEQPALSMIHTAFMRWHNRLADRLAPIAAANGWTEETLFQETRKIVAAAMQHIAYNEYLPLVLGDLYMNFFGLYSAPTGFSFVYSPFIDASIRNVFAAASYRYGHSQVPNELGKLGMIDGAPVVDLRLLENTFFDPNMILTPPFSAAGANGLARFTATDRSHVVDSRIEQSVRDKLFKSQMDFFDSLDLAALNIQRGRDHGLPPYNAYRVLCGRPPYLTWADALLDHTPTEVAKLQDVYIDPRDIDMFTGALSEIPVPGGLVGPTNACILGNQFRALKRGDRFFYENPFATTGFSLDQLNSIKGITLAKIICETMYTSMVQPNIFLNAGLGNPLTNCADLPDIDIQAFWSGPQPFRRHPHRRMQVVPPQSPISALKFQRIPKFLVPRFQLRGKHAGKPGHKGPLKTYKG